MSTGRLRSAGELLVVLGALLVAQVWGLITFILCCLGIVLVHAALGPTVTAIVAVTWLGGMLLCMGVGVRELETACSPSDQEDR